MNKNSPLFRHAAKIAVLALLLQVFLPLLHPAMAANAVLSADGVMAINHGIHHCSVKSDASSKNHASKTSQQKAPNCPICTAMHLLAGGYVSPQDVALTVVNYRPSPLIPRPDERLASARIRTSAQPRAPPSLI